MRLASRAVTVVDKDDPQLLRLVAWEKIFCGAVGGVVLLAAALTTVIGAWKDWTVNSVAIGALFAVGLVLLVLAVAGRLPNSVSVSDKGFALGYVAGAKETAENAAEKMKEVNDAIKDVPKQQETQQAMASATDHAAARQALTEAMAPIVDEIPTDAASLLPDRAEQMQKIAEAITLR